MGGVELVVWSFCAVSRCRSKAICGLSFLVVRPKSCRNVCCSFDGDACCPGWCRYWPCVANHIVAEKSHGVGVVLYQNATPSKRLAGYDIMLTYLHKHVSYFVPNLVCSDRFADFRLFS